MMNAIEARELRKSFGAFTLDGVSLTLPMGSALGLIGENGAGKSTTISLLLGLLARDGGEVSLLGRGEPDAAVREEIGVVLDEANFPDGLTARRVDRVERLLYREWDTAAYREHLRRFALPEDKPFRSFSRGMKMKLALAVALSHHARLLVLDEATAGLDPLARDELLGELAAFLADGEHAILLSSHIISDIEKLCDRVAFLHRGKLLLCAEKQALLAEHPGQNLEQIILNLTRKELGA